MTALLVGDVAGHLTALDEVLEPFDVSVSEGHVPEGTVVVQVGDLIGRSPESSDLITAVERIRRRLPDRWIQLAGNHELHHLGGHRFEGTRNLTGDAVEILEGWLHEGWLRLAVAIEHAGSDALVTHAGLTRALWLELGAPASAEVAAAAISGLRPTPEGWDVLNRSGRMLNLGRFPLTDPSAGPIWAEAAFELAPDWVEHGDLPFDQIHGHSSVYDWFRGRLRSLDLARLCSIDHDARHVVIHAGNHTITGIDPGLGRDGHARWSPLVTRGALRSIE